MKFFLIILLATFAIATPQYPEMGIKELIESYHLTPIFTTIFTTIRSLPEITFDDILLIFEGLMQGLNTAKELDNLVRCFTSIPGIVKKAEAVIEKLKKVNWTDVESAIDGVVDIIFLIQDGIDIVIPCIGIPVDFRFIIHRIGNLTWTILVSRLKAEIWSIGVNIAKAIRSLQSGHYQDFGIEIGTILHSIFLKVKLMLMNKY